MNRTILTAIIVAALTLSIAPAFAAKKAITLEEATKIAKEHVQGDVIKAEREMGLYGVKLLTPDGKRVKLYIDAETGKIVRSKGKRISLNEAIGAAKKAVSGEVLKAEYERGRYEVKIRKTDGTLTELYIDAATGEISKKEVTKRYYEDEDDD